MICRNEKKKTAIAAGLTLNQIQWIARTSSGEGGNSTRLRGISWPVVPLVPSRSWFPSGSSVQGAPVASGTPTHKERPLILFHCLQQKLVLCGSEEWYHYHGVQETVHGKRGHTEPEQGEQSCKMPNKRPEDWHDPCHRYSLCQPNNQNPKTIAFGMDVAPQDSFPLENCSKFKIEDGKIHW